MTTNDDEEIKKLLDMVLQASKLGLIHESVNVNSLAQYTSKSPPLLFLSLSLLCEKMLISWGRCRKLVRMGKRSLCRSDIRPGREETTFDFQAGAI